MDELSYCTTCVGSYISLLACSNVTSPRPFVPLISACLNFILCSFYSSALALIPEPPCRTASNPAELLSFPSHLASGPRASSSVFGSPLTSLFLAWVSSFLPLHTLWVYHRYSCTGTPFSLHRPLGIHFSENVSRLSPRYGVRSIPSPENVPDCLPHKHIPSTRVPATLVCLDYTRKRHFLVTFSLRTVLLRASFQSHLFSQNSPLGG
jgi:hypothetical protein